MAVAEENLKVEGMSCNHCKRAVEKAVGSLPGVLEVEADPGGGKVRVVYEPGSTGHQDIVAAITGEGYRVRE